MIRMIRPTTLAMIAMLTAALSWVPTSAQDRLRGPETLGQVHFPISCAPEAQQHFDRAMALYHSFHWAEVRKAFDAVLAADPACAMAYWGHAVRLMDNPFLWPLTGKNLGDGLEMVQKAKALGVRTPREREYIAAVEAFYRDHDRLDHRTRATALEQALADLVARHPTDVEAAVLYSLVLSANFDPGDKTYAKQLRAAAILEKLFASHPEHPGVPHYLIHSYDYPPIAGQGVAAARRYARVAPSAPHALHMPSHIFTRLGHWQESIASNIAASQAIRDPRGRLHAWDYLTYAYLQLGRDDDARRVAEEVGALQKFDGYQSFVTAYAIAAVPMRHALERGRWTEAARISLSPAEPDFGWGRFPHAEAVNAFGRGVGAARSGDAAAARRELQRLIQLRHRMLDVRQPYWAGQADIQIEVVEAWVARAEGRNAEALRLLRHAAEREDGTEKSVVTPGPLMPAREQLAELLLELSEPVAALEQFEAVLRKEPNRFRTLAGAARAAELSGSRERATTLYAALLSLTATAQGERPEVKAARAFLGR